MGSKQEKQRRYYIFYMEMLPTGDRPIYWCDDPASVGAFDPSFENCNFYSNREVATGIAQMLSLDMKTNMVIGSVFVEVDPYFEMEVVKYEEH